MSLLGEIGWTIPHRELGWPRTLLQKGGGPRFEPPGGTLRNFPVYWEGLSGRFSGAPKGLWGCVSGPITPRISKKKMVGLTFNQLSGVIILTLPILLLILFLMLAPNTLKLIFTL